MAFSVFDEERKKIKTRMIKLNKTLRDVTESLEVFQARYVAPIIGNLNPSPIHLILLNETLRQAANYSTALFELKKIYLAEVEKIKEVDKMEAIHNELAKFKI